MNSLDIMFVLLLFSQDIATYSHIPKKNLYTRVENCQTFASAVKSVALTPGVLAIL